MGTAYAVIRNVSQRRRAGMVLTNTVDAAAQVASGSCGDYAFLRWRPDSGTLLNSSTPGMSPRLLT